MCNSLARFSDGLSSDVASGRGQGSFSAALAGFWRSRDTWAMHDHNEKGWRRSSCSTFRLSSFGGTSRSGDEAQRLNFGPHTILSVPAVTMNGGGDPVAAGVDIDVVVLDVGEEVVPCLIPYASSTVSEEEIIGYGEELAHLPDPGVLVQYALEWVTSVGGDPATFYSAEEGGGAEAGNADPATPKAKAKQASKAAEKAPKRGSAAQVAAKINSLAELIPTIMDRLGEIQTEQKRLQGVVEGAGSVQPRPTQAPVSMPLRNFAQLVGSPPRPKGWLSSPHPQSCLRNRQAVLRTLQRSFRQREE